MINRVRPPEVQARYRLAGLPGDPLGGDRVAGRKGLLDSFVQEGVLTRHKVFAGLAIARSGIGRPVGESLTGVARRVLAGIDLILCFRTATGDHGIPLSTY